MCWTSKEARVTIFRWWNLRTTTAIKKVLGWDLMRHYMEGPVDHRRVGWKRARAACLGRRLFGNYREDSTHPREATHGAK